jgi:uncharacterized pyridoxal phosphate-containing UPF0001 family protein
VYVPEQAQVALQLIYYLVTISWNVVGHVQDALLLYVAEFLSYIHSIALTK